MMNQADAETLRANLNPQHAIWADEYIRTKSKRKASKAAGCSQSCEAAIDSYGTRVYRRPDVRAYLEAMWRDNAMGAREVIERLSEAAAFDISEIIIVTEGGTPMIDAQKMKELGYDRFLKSIGFDSNGNVKYEFVDSQAALRDVGRAHKLFGDKNELSGPDGGAVPMELIVKFVDPPQTGQNVPIDSLTEE